VMWHKPAIKKSLIIAVVFAIGFAVGVPIGARVGLWEFMLADSKYKASILASDIKSIKAGHTEHVVTAMEISLNGELAKYGEYMESHLWWLWPELRSSDDRPIRDAVSYRLAHPYDGPDLAKPENWNPGIDMQDPFVRNVVEGQRIQREYMRQVLQRYGNMPRNGTVERDAGRSGAHPSP
ncbi:MAG TPA: hypothetical protein VJR90_00100, partial [Gammaproteobacteria bacterium]|nr:hypothetical protein [Gammaproteobacteria bacterium]